MAKCSPFGNTEHGWWLWPVFLGLLTLVGTGLIAFLLPGKGCP